MKILVSAIACDPTGGSEGAVGWAAIQRIALRHEVRVLTHAQFRNSWDRTRESGGIPDNIRVRFLGVDKAWHPNRLIARLQSWTRFLAFNRDILLAARAWYDEEPFDLAHHVTYATWRVPSPLWQLPVPFIWGPIAGAARFPSQFLPLLSPAARAFEHLRNLSSFVAARSRAFHDCVREAAVVIAANEETEAFLKPYRGGRPLLNLPVAFLSANTIERFHRPLRQTLPGDPLRLFAGGNMIGSKGLALAVEALKRVKDAGVAFRYTIAGGGPEIPKIEALVRKLGLESEVEFHPGFHGDDYVRAVQEADIYFLPSFREALGLTMVEAVLAGCYPVVADASMPGEIIRKMGGSAVRVGGIEQMIAELAATLVGLDQRREDLAIEAAAIREKIVSYFCVESYDECLECAYRIALTPSMTSPRDREIPAMPP